MGIRVLGANIAAAVVNKGCAEVIAGAGGYKGFQNGFAPCLSALEVRLQRVLKQAVTIVEVLV